MYHSKKFKKLSSKTAFGLSLCLLLFAIFSFVHGGKKQIAHAQQTQNDQLNQAQTDRSALETQLAQLEFEIAQKEQELKGQQGQSASLSNEIKILKTQIDKAKLDIKAKTLTISKLSDEISQKSDQIQTLTDRIDTEKQSLGQLIRNTRDMDQSNVLDIALSAQSVSQFYDDVNAYDSIKGAIKQSVDTIQGVQTETEDAKQLLEQKQNQELDAKHSLEQAQKQVEQSQAEQKQLLSISKNKEQQYAAILADRASKAATIRAKLFQLAGGGGAIQFGDALNYAEHAQALTGVDPAFLLAILTQESNLGANQGKCYLTVPSTGAGVRVSTGALVSNVMKPSRDVTPFMSITTALSIDPFKQVVSCPLSGGGYGGAMGPAQFIPSTWVNSALNLAGRIGKAMPDPWDPNDAFAAGAFYLSDLGASGATYSGERNAACKYYSGRKCDSKKPANSFYGNSVMTLATSIQSDIDYLKQYGVSRR